MTKSETVPLKKFQLKQDEIVLSCLWAEQNRNISQHGITEFIPNLSIISIRNKATESFGMGSIFEDIQKLSGYNPGQPALDQTTSRDPFQPQPVPMIFFSWSSPCNPQPPLHSFLSQVLT